jgi:Cu-Zn family superoxide dismutase
MKKPILVLIVMAFCLIVPSSVLAQAQQAAAEIKDAGGQVVGNAIFTQQSEGVRISVEVKNLSPGKHGIHIHAQGRCDPPGFTTAGGHFNPYEKQHGALNPMGPHAGDVPNLDVAQDGTGKLDYTDMLVTLASGVDNSLFKTNGTSLVIHANPDDEKTDPSGNSGTRIACGLILTVPMPSFIEVYGWAIAALIAIAVIVVAVVVVKLRNKKPAA